MFENVVKFLKKFNKKEKNVANNSKEAAKERLHLVLMQDRANVSADFLELMKQEIIEVIKKYIEVDEGAIDVRLTNKENEDGTNGAPALYANIPILNIKNEARKIDKKDNKQSEENRNQTNNEKSDKSKDNKGKNKKDENLPDKKISKKETPKNNVDENKENNVQEENKNESNTKQSEKDKIESKENEVKKEENKEKEKVKQKNN